ncbi:MAG: fibrillarin-like rRNA/tRNA 2'-O-methyltransferase [Candidatus Hodarchaeota archaeon]
MNFTAKPHEKSGAVYTIVFEDESTRIATRNLYPGNRVYGEQLLKAGDEEYRLWEPYRSKLAAAILKGISKIPVKLGDKVLYLGAATGTTASHVSDIVGNHGFVYCVEFSSRAMRQLLSVCESRQNMLPILADARFPETYSMIVGAVDGIYCDVAQPEQARLLADNADSFLRTNGHIMLAVKARSIDVTKEPVEIYKREIEILQKRGFFVRDTKKLEPFSSDHTMILAEYERKFAET